MLKPLGDRVVLKVEEKEQKVGGFVIAGNGQAATKTAEIVTTTKKDKFGEIADGIVYDKTTKDSEIVKLTEDVEDYFAREVYPHVPDAHYWFDEEKGYGAEIPFTRYFYQYQAPESADKLLAEFYELEEELQNLLEELKHD